MDAPTFDEESALWSQGYRFVAGVDEVGRGALAGPVMAAAAILPAGLDEPWLRLVRDSKLLSPQQRSTIYGYIEQAEIATAVGLVSAEDIDRLGIAPATRLAMQQAVAKLAPSPDFVLIDGMKQHGLKPKLPQRSIIDGDRSCISISCASIVAKVVRDRLMEQMDALYQGYGFARHKGYGTAEHLAALTTLGPCPIHRRCFAPMRELQ